MPSIEKTKRNSRKSSPKKAPALGYECQFFNSSQTIARSGALNPKELRGALWSSAELAVDPRQIIAELPRFLHEKYRVQFHFNTAIDSAASLKANAIIIASGDDFQSLYPEHFCNAGVTRCKLQMLRTVAQPADGNWARR